MIERLSDNIKPCTYCTKYGHTAWKCPRKPQKALVSRSRIKAVGKQTRRTNNAVAAWKRTVKPNHQGFYECYICKKWVTYLLAEHVESKARRPDLRTDSSNFKTACRECNKLKGSKDVKEFL